MDEIVRRRLELILTYPLDAHLIYHGLSMSSGQVMSVELLEEFEFPYLERNVRMIRTREFPSRSTATATIASSSRG